MAMTHTTTAPRTRSKRRPAVLSALVAGAIGASSLLLAAPAQAADCNSTRVCFWHDSGRVSNLDPDAAFPGCSTGVFYVSTTLEKAQNRSNRSVSAFIVSGSIRTPISQLDPGETIKYTPGAEYAFCLTGW
ncbi:MULTISPECIES: hypothetical protein [unclassified Streptomyces]|uniref:hypothetical protein n=1 Tax=unclassified Streptomyces TaxID=2593676 RepID=UPI001367E8FB|nr:hypothetical protein [Streptomyces sp. SID2563]MYW12942.1 hypothetical protein [Streptomyces sp. SID2563]